MDGDWVKKPFLSGSGDLWSVPFVPKVALLRTGVQKFLSVSANCSGTQQPARQFRNPKYILECDSREIPSHLLSVSTITPHSQTNSLINCSCVPDILFQGSPVDIRSSAIENRDLCAIVAQREHGKMLYICVSGIRSPLTTVRTVYCVGTFCMEYTDPV